MTLFDAIAERRIVDAMEAGELNDLPGAGQPLALHDDRGVPAELRVAYRVLMNAGMVPEEVAVRTSIQALEARLTSMTHGAEHTTAHRRLVLLRARLDARGPGRLSPAYEQQLLAKLGRA